MKIRVDQLTQHLNKNLAPIYVITGDETLLVEEACEQIRKAATQQNYLERQTIHAENQHFNWDLLLEKCSNYSLFSQKCLIEFRLPSGKPGTQGSQALKTYAEQAAANNLLIIIMPKLEAAAQNSVWFKELDKAGVIIQIWPIDKQRLPQWINTRLEKHELQATPAAIKILIDRHEGNLLALDQTITKLHLLFQNQTLTEQHILDNVNDSTQFDVYELLDAALLGNSERVIAILTQLKNSAAEPTLILWAITKELRALATMANQIEKGIARDAAIAKAFVWEKRRSLVAAALQRYSSTKFYRLLQQALIIDTMIKGMREGNVWHAFSDLLLNLAGVPLFRNKVSV